ncbi:MAG: hemolysin III family protein [Comamonadaceae bacterium]|nr:MAG: hemolysin III family protein [Comamonadaceae bacterium]
MSRMYNVFFFRERTSMRAGERFNALSHLFATFGVACYGVFLLLQQARQADHGAVAGLACFVAAAMVTYAASTAFHSARGRVRPLLERIDNAAIFILIAGSYTPFALAAPRGELHVCLLALVWCLAMFAGYRALKRKQPPELGWYIGLGWIAVAAAFPVAMRASDGSLAWLLAGALAYSAGTVFYLNRMGWRHAHGVWHLCVFAGTTAHMTAVSQLTSS